MNYLLSGSFAYDTIFSFNGKFEKHILPESISRLNLSFAIDNEKNEFGGSGGNIAYNASLLGDKPMLLGVLGENDITPYIVHLKKINANVDNLTILKNKKCAHAWILTDKNNNQITTFNMGVMKYQSIIPEITPEVWHLAPENPLTTASLAKKAVEQNKIYLFDPGQCLTSFVDGLTNHIYTLNEIVKNANGIFVNHYEWEILAKYLSVSSPFEFIGENQFLIKTLGEKGVDLFYNKKVTHYNVVDTDQTIDPTGCGDSFRAGFLHAYIKGLSLEEATQLGAVMGHYTIQHYGGQNHNILFEDIMLKWEDTKTINRKKPHF